MGLLTEEIKVTLHSMNINWYRGKGYNIPTYKSINGKLQVKRGTKILVRIEDLIENSAVSVDIQCDGCGEILENIQWQNYKKSIHKDETYYCHKCAIRLFGVKKIKLTKLKNSKSFYQWCYDNLSKEVADWILSRWDYELNKISPKDVSYGSMGFNKKGYWFKCIDHPEHKSELKNIHGFVGPNRQVNINCNQCNKILVTHPYLVKWLLDPEDALKYSYGSRIKIPMRCPDCGHIKPQVFGSLISQGFSCPKCSDGISYPEKFMSNVLDQLHIIFNRQLSKTIFKWCGVYKYDNYIDSVDCIIETHGEQHYKENHFSTLLSEIQENDFDKEWLARENKINNYIILDCRHSTVEWIKNSIMNSKLPKLLNFKESDIDWLKCHEVACSNIAKTACDLWKEGTKDILEIMYKLKICRSTARKYLKQGEELNWCDYSLEKERKKVIASLVDRCGVEVICLNTGEIFASQKEAERQYNCNGISACCRNVNKSAGVHPTTGKPLIWLYHNEYIIKNQMEGWLEEYICSHSYGNGVKIICLTTGEIFGSVKEAANRYNIRSGNISSCCNEVNRQKTSGKHPDTREPLVWMYYDEYMLKTKEQIKNIINESQLSNLYKLKVICLTTGMIFNSIVEAEVKYKANASGIVRCCKEKQNFAGKHPITKEPLKWQYYSEYIKLNPLPTAI